MGKIEQISLLSNVKIWFSKMPYFCWVDSGLIFYMSKGFFLQNHLKKSVFMFMKNYKEMLSSKLALNS